MSNDYAANFGYIVQIDNDTINAFNITKEMLIDQFSEDEWDDQDQTVAGILEVLAMSSEDLNLTIGEREFKVRLYYYGEARSEYDGLDEGESYILFDESDLWTQTPTELLRNLSDKNIQPTFQSWLSYG